MEEVYYSYCCGKVVVNRGNGTVCSHCDDPVTKQGYPPRASEQAAAIKLLIGRQIVFVSFRARDLVGLKLDNGQTLYIPYDQIINLTRNNTTTENNNYV